MQDPYSNLPTIPNFWSDLPPSVEAAHAYNQRQAQAAQAQTYLQSMQEMQMQQQHQHTLTQQQQQHHQQQQQLQAIEQLEAQFQLQQVNWALFVTSCLRFELNVPLFSSYFSTPH